MARRCGYSSIQFTVRDLVSIISLCCVALAWHIEYATRPEMTRICVAARNIELGMPISHSMIKWEPCPENQIPDGAIFLRRSAVGKRARTRILAGKPLLASLTYVENPQVPYPPPHHRVVSIKVQSASGSISPNDMVDVLEVTAKDSATIVRCSRVVGIDELGAGKAVVSCIVREDDLEKLLCASERAKLCVALVKTHSTPSLSP